MKRHQLNITALLSAVLLYLVNSTAHAQTPPLQWATQYGGGNVDIPFTIKMTTDGGTIVGGYTDSKSGDVSPQPNRDFWDLWLVKLDKCGQIEWEKSLGGTGYESARDLVQTSDGGYLVLGETNSTDRCSRIWWRKDIWLLASMGFLEWQKRFGGSGLDKSLSTDERWQLPDCASSLQ
jgi:hypothetical protein